MKIDPAHLRRFAPLLVPAVIAGLGWMLIVRPATTENASVARELEGLRQRLTFARSQIGAPAPAEPAGDPLKSFERQVAAGDASGMLLEELSRLALDAGLMVDVIETGDQVVAPLGGGPGVAGGAPPDPRFRLFQVPLTYSPVMMTVDADYAKLGDFLWRLRDLATVIEVRTLEISRPTPGAGETAVAPPATVHATLTIFAYARVAEGPAQAGRHVTENAEGRTE